MISVNPKGPLQFDDWQSEVNLKSFTKKIRLYFEGEDEFCAVIVVGPTTERFDIEGPDELASPLMPLLDAQHDHIEYDVTFKPPDIDDEGHEYFNFQDRIVFYSRTSSITIPLYALQEDSSGIFPPTLSKAKKPSNRMFALVEKEANSISKKQQSREEDRNEKPVVLNTKLDAVNVIRRLRAKRSTEVCLTGESKSFDLSTFNTIVKDVAEESCPRNDEEKEHKFYESILNSPLKPKAVKPTSTVQEEPNNDSSCSSDEEEEEEYEAALPAPTEVAATLEKGNSYDFSSSDDDEPIISTAVVEHTEEDYEFYQSIISPKKILTTAEPKAPNIPPPASHRRQRRPQPTVISAAAYLEQKVQLTNDTTSSSEEETPSLGGFINDDKDDGCYLSEPEI